MNALKLQFRVPEELNSGVWIFEYPIRVRAQISHAHLALNPLDSAESGTAVQFPPFGVSPLFPLIIESLKSVTTPNISLSADLLRFSRSYRKYMETRWYRDST